MDRLPADLPSRAKFAKLFREFSTCLQAARIQGFTWDKTEYSSRIDPEDQSTEETITLIPTQEQADILLQRYKELRGPGPVDPKDGDDDITFPIDPYLTEQNTGVIDNDYMNSRFEKFMINESKATDYLKDYYENWVSVYKEGAIRDVTLLYEWISTFLSSHKVLALATGAGDYVCCTPLDFSNSDKLSLVCNNNDGLSQ